MQTREFEVAILLRVVVLESAVKVDNEALAGRLAMPVSRLIETVSGAANVAVLLRGTEIVDRDALPQPEPRCGMCGSKAAP